MHEPETITPVRGAALTSTRIAHGFFTRQGGVSTGIYRSLNGGTGSSDERPNVEENRRRAAATFGATPAIIVSPWQVHSPDAVIVDKPFEGERPRADAIVTDTPGLAIGVLTADCGPILFFDEGANVIGAAHAGWKGALGGVLENTVAAMETIGARASRIKAVLGPSISQANYEVGPEFVETFMNAAVGNAAWFAPSSRAGHSMFDLWGYTLDRLAKAGVEASCVNLCTYADEERFYSYRRGTHRKEPDYGRQISAIMLKG
ncbi:MAG: peptidoglycan editing factor PgeF [Rhizobiaceae bacterium]